MRLGRGTPSGPRLAACNLQNNNADLDVKLVSQTLGISGLLGFNPCPLFCCCFHAMCHQNAGGSWCLCGSFLFGYQAVTQLQTQNPQVSLCSLGGSSCFLTPGVNHATFLSPQPRSLLTSGRRCWGWFSGSLPAFTSLFHPAQPISLPQFCSLLFLCCGKQKLGKTLFGEGSHFHPSCLPSI